MDLNTIIFGGLAILSFATFFYLGKMRASKAQRERDDRIDWSTRKFSLFLEFKSLTMAPKK